MHRFILVFAVAALAACASETQTGPSVFEKWTYAGCWDQEEETGITFEQCLDEFVANQCVAEGFQPETPAYRRCQKDTRRIAFTQHQYKLLRNSNPTLF